MSESEAINELWVSGDGELVLFRAAGAGPARVARAGRSVDAAEGCPVVLLSGDELTVGGRRLRVHVHGPAPAVSPPSYLPVEREEPRGGRGRVFRAAAAALALSAAGGVAGCKSCIEVRTEPPSVEAIPPDGRSAEEGGKGKAPASQPASQPASRPAKAE